MGMCARGDHVEVPACGCLHQVVEARAFVAGLFTRELVFKSRDNGQPDRWAMAVSSGNWFSVV